MNEPVFLPQDCEPYRYSDEEEAELVNVLLDEVVRKVSRIQDEGLRLQVLNAVLDGPQARKLQGERQKLDPWGQWMHSTYLDASQGHPEWRESAETRRVISHWQQGMPEDADASNAEALDANLIVSDTGIDDKKGRRLHIPMFDVDLPMRVVPSTNPGKGHLYINKPMPWENIVKLIDVLVEVGIVHRNYRAHSVERGSTTLRPAFVDKPDKGWSSDSDEMPFPDGALDDALVPDYAKDKAVE